MGKAERTFQGLRDRTEHSMPVRVSHEGWKLVTGQLEEAAKKDQVREFPSWLSRNESD